MGNHIQLIECPRDAMQGWPHFIATEKKIAYINALLEVGFDTIDFGSFVSPKAIPQMADTREVLAGLKLSNTNSSLLSIVANLRGAEQAVSFEEIEYLGYPFSISETFQQRNTNVSIEEAYNQVAEIQNLCFQHKKKLVVYMSMGFGNPYGDIYNEEIVFNWVQKISQLGVGIISLADTVGVAEPAQVEKVTKQIINALPDIDIGVHLHSTSRNREEKLQAALNAGCKRIDGAIKGIGGCPMAGNELVGNMQTEWMVDFLLKHGYSLQINENALAKSIQMAAELFV